ncbi:hypothetical protein HanRHA438_Chr17g0807941 [Helianthus annuus]|uniref:Uncharacterized protein n=1 Tax=Helianthus annuus TaxID=4232 RepID=A0A9K3DIT2_HELAN|nr:hypothetical protein HanXRQr2_Chr17g0797861 [Helianthus annuus]KAJ0812763.1 hypothetical protein HanPSC8_Chr17g0765621 [Helianthus annuus]KAJ0825872.1 hypothetical protein HanRHA438_Chr17g0807941 [Helianthus annuus]
MTAVNQPVTRVKNDRKTTSSFKVFEESDGSSSEDMESYSPKSVVLRRRKVVKNVNRDVFGRRVRNQIERIRAEDLHLGEDIGECLYVKICGAGHEEDQDVVRPASLLSGKVRVG